MNQETKAPALTGNPGLLKEQQSNNTIRPLKWRRVLAALAAGESYNRFEAERALHDHCLHSTVSDLQHKKGLVIYREDETVPGYKGMPTHVCRYWLAPESFQKAREILGWQRPIDRYGANLGLFDANTGA